MKKILLFYFSGTNNTKIIATEIVDEFRDMDFALDIYNIREPFKELPNLNDYEYIGFGYPIHAFNTPEFFLKFIKKLPKVENKQAFIFKTSGEPFHFNNASSFALVRILKKKGFMPLIDEHFLMPYNIMFRYPDIISKHMYIHNLKLVKVLVKEVLSEQDYLPRYYPWTVIFAYLSRIQWLGAKINGPLIHVKKSKCTACGLCIKNCPSNNIKMVNGYPKFDHTCTMCMSCVAICPFDAVRPGILNGWRVNGLYDFKKILNDESIPTIEINKQTKGYFKLFRKYYKKSYNRITEHE